MFKNIYDSPESVERKFYVSDSTLFRLRDGDMFTDYELWTGEGKTGTQLGEGTDFVVGGKSNNASAIKGEDVYTGFQILSATYHDTVLYATITWVGTLGNADTIKPNGTPFYGDPINSDDILYADGYNPMSSEGVLPLVDTSKVVEPFITVDGQRYDNEQVIHPGKRPARYIGEELENLIVNGNDADSWTDSGTATSSQAGEWVKIDNGGTPSAARSSQSISSTGSFVILAKLIIKNIDAVVTSFGYGPRVDITWATESVSYDSGAEEIAVNWLVPNEVVEITASLDSTVSPNDFAIFPDETNANKSVLFKDAMAIDFGSDTPYPVPYFEGVLPKGVYVDQLQGLDAGFTLQVPFKPGNSSVTSYILGVYEYTDVGGSNVLVYQNTSGNLALDCVGDTGNVGSLLTQGQAYDLKVVFKADFSVEVYLDGVLDVTANSTVTEWANIDTVNLGNGENFTSLDRQLRGFIGELLYRPSIDTTATHSQLGEPWIDSRASYSEFGDKEGPNGDYGVTDLKTAYPLPGEWVEVWRGSSQTPSIDLGTGIFILKADLTGSSGLYATLVIHHLDADRNDYSAAFISVTDVNNRLIGLIRSDGTPESDGSGTYATSTIQEIYKLVQ